LRALRILADRGASVPQAVFAGSDQGALESVRKQAADLKLSNRLNILGFVPSEHMPYLYKGCVALVMPTYFGPTNLPPLEARALGVPVIYSDLPSFREQMGDEALYIDLEDPASLAEQLELLMATGLPATAQSSPQTEEPVSAYAEILRQIVFRHAQRL
jgi:glycosyltransferase involved in cell wall biosynthesis